jgi:hypothetical protein
MPSSNLTAGQLAERSISLTYDTAALARTEDTTISSATTITLHADCNIIEVNAIGGGVYLRYQAGVTNANFDEFIISNTVRHFFKPSGVTAISVLERTAGAAVIVIEK